MYYFARRSEELYPEEEIWDSNIKWYIAIFTLISGLRYCVGGDYFSYAKIFEKGLIVEERANQEILWNWLVKITSDLSLTSVFGFSICGFLQIYFLVKACGNKKFMLLTLPFVMFGSRYFLDMEGAVRQMTAACFFVWFSKFIIERNFIKYAICVLAASLFHHSAFILLIFYFIPDTLNLAGKPKIMIAIFLICFVLGISPQFNNVVEYIENFAVFLGYSEYETRVSIFLTDLSRQETLAFGPMMLSYFIVALSTILFGPFLRNKYLADNKNLNLWYNLSFIYACLYFLVANTSHIFIRPIQYFEFFQMMSVSLLLYALLNDEETIKGFKYYSIGLILILWVNTSWDIYKNYNNPYNFSTYKTIFFKSNNNTYSH